MYGLGNKGENIERMVSLSTCDGDKREECLYNLLKIKNFIDISHIMAIISIE